ncbi:MAG: ATP-grasp domain-containing protein [Candidatus Omnitrophica bacterium]|nr:ATP-grasp domain-containing protein [Candidatus Omnitrophota bacterium]
MGKITIGIVGAENEAHSAHMKNILQEKGIDTLIIDTLKYPESVTLSITDNDVIYNGKSLRNINVFYIRSLFYSLPPYDLEQRRRETEVDLDNWYVEYMAERERQSHLTSWLWIEAGKGKHIINPVDSFDTHYLKPYQIYLLRKNGIPIPKTLVTNDEEKLIEFVKKTKRLIYKPVAGGAKCKELFKKDLTRERLERLRNSPVLFQELIEGDNIRVYVINNKIVSSNVIKSDALDYRGSEKEIFPISLPDKVKKRCIKAVKICKMKYSGIDLRRKSSGEYVFLECNPSPMFLGMVEAAGDPIDEYFADYLIKLAKSRI